MIGVEGWGGKGKRERDRDNEIGRYAKKEEEKWIVLLFSFLFFLKRQLILYLASGPPNKGIQKILVWGSHFWKQEFYVSFIICITLPVLLKIKSIFSWSLISNIHFAYGYKYGKKISSFSKIFFVVFLPRESGNSVKWYKVLYNF